MNDTERYSYYAFVSYSHKDAKWAAWIQRAIEHYKLPAVVRREAQKPLPKRIAPVFRDATDLGVDVLVDGLHAELESSRYLIVVCSPNSAKPNADGRSFVDEEVRHFCELGRVRQIIPVIIDGTPEEAFGPILKSQEILAIDATKHPRARVLNDIVAKILGLKPDALWRRAERERRKKLVLRSALCGLAGLCAAFAGWFAWDSNRLVKNYYADYVDSFGLPEGIFPLSSDEIIRRHVHYRFEYRGYGWGRSIHRDSSGWTVFKSLGFYRVLRRVVAANSAGVPTAININAAFIEGCPPIQDFIYEQSGASIGYRLSERIERDFSGKLLRRVVYSARHHGVTNGLAGFFGVGEGRENILFGRSAVAQHELVRDAAGRVRQRRFLNAIGRVVPNAAGVCAIEYYELDQWGRVVKQSYLTRSGHGDVLVRRANKIGVAGKEYLYEKDSPNLKMMSYFGMDNKRVLGPHGWWAFERMYDKSGRVVQERFLGIDGEKVLNKSRYAERMIEYNEKGECIEQRMMDVDGCPTFTADGYAGYKISYDVFGREVERQFLGTRGEKVFNGKGISMARKHYGENGKVEMVENFGVNGEIVYDKNGCACVRYAYDKNGNVIKTSWLDEKHNPVLCNMGYSSEVDAYNDKGQKVQTDFYGLNGEHVCNGFGVATIKKSYDDYGNEADESFFGVDGLPVVYRYGYSRCHREYDKRGYKIKEEYFGADGERALGLNGLSGYSYEYDDFGNCTKKTNLGIEGTPCVGKYSGFAAEVMEYNSIGQVVRGRYLDEKGMDTESWMGVAGLSRNYDSAGYVVEECFYDKAGRPAIERLKGAKRRFAYNLQGKKILEESFDENGKLWANYKGVARIEHEYDGRGVELKTSYFGEDGSPIRNTFNISVIINEYDKRGRLKRESFFDENMKAVLGKPYLAPFSYAGRELDYDERGRLIVEHYLDCDNKPIRSGAGRYSEKRISYNERGQVLSEQYFDGHGEKVKCEAGYCAVMREYDIVGRMTNEFYYSAEGNLIPCRYGYAQKRLTYDSFGNCVRTEHFGVRGGRVASTRHHGESITENIFDRYNRKIGVKFLDARGLPMIGRFKYAEERNRYDSRGHVSRVEYYGTNGAPTLALLDVAGYEQECDMVGNVTRKYCFGLDGKPITNSLGYVEKRMQYNDKNKLIQEEYFDANGCRCLGTGRVVGRRFEYDKVGNIIKESYIGFDGGPTPCGDAYYEKRMTYYKWNQMASESYWDRHGNLFKVSRNYGEIGRLILYNNDKKLLTAYFTLDKNNKVICLRVTAHDDDNREVTFVQKNGLDGVWKGGTRMPAELCEELVSRFSREIKGGGTCR